MISREGYDYSITAFNESGTYHLFWCGNPFQSGSLDAIYHASSKFPDSNFSQASSIRIRGCAPTIVKVPRNFSSFCNQSESYLLYAESSPLIDKIGYGNKIELSYSCDLINWIFVGSVLQLNVFGSNYPYGVGHPNALFFNNTLYLTYYQSTIGTEGGDTGVYLAASNNGINFVNKGKIGLHAGTEIKYIPQKNVFVGILNDGTLFFKKNLLDFIGYQSDFGYWGSMQPHRNYNSAMRYPWWCSEGQAILTDPYGNLNSLNFSQLTTFVYSGEWDAPSSARTSEGKCYAAGDERGKGYVENSEIYATKLILDLNFVNCSYNYSSWSNCSVEGVQTREVVEDYPNNCINEPVISATCDYIPSCSNTDWISIDSNCSSSGFLNRTWFSINRCSGGIYHNSIEFVSCNFSLPSCLDFNYSSWSNCSAEGVMLREIVSKSPDSCIGGAPHVLENCTFYANEINQTNSSYNEVNIYFSSNYTLSISNSTNASNLDSRDFYNQSFTDSKSSFNFLIAFFKNILCKLSNLFNQDSFYYCGNT